jgi:hypothetical protein
MPPAILAGRDFGRVSAAEIVETAYIGDIATPIDNVVKVKFSTQKPATLTIDTDFIDVTGQIKGYDFQPDCTVFFKLTLFKRVE